MAAVVSVLRGCVCDCLAAGLVGGLAATAAAAGLVCLAAPTLGAGSCSGLRADVLALGPHARIIKWINAVYVLRLPIVRRLGRRPGLIIFDGPGSGSAAGRRSL